MKQESGKRRVSLLLVGLLVWFLPLLFFTSILQEVIKRNRDAAISLLREKILYVAEKANEKFKPDIFVKNTIARAHQTIMPDVLPELAQMIPSEDFGLTDFTRSTPQQFSLQLEKLGLKPLLVVVNPPDFSDTFFWASPMLTDQCDETDKLAWALTSKVLYISSNAFRQNYQTELPNVALASWNIFHQMNEKNSDTLTLTYLSRFGELIPSLDTIVSMFSDYFGQQLLFYYTYSCMSPVKIHGSYSIIIPQSSISSDQILESALANQDSEIELQISHNEPALSRFFENDKQIDFYFKPNTEFWNHYFYVIRQQRIQGKPETKKTDFSIKVSARLPENLQKQEKLLAAANMLNKISLIIYLALALHYYLFGMTINLRVKYKLAFILGLIILFPIAGTGLLTISSLSDSDRLIDSQVYRQTENALEHAVLMEEENIQRFLLTALETRRAIETRTTNHHNILAKVAIQDNPVNWFSAGTNSTSIGFANGDYFNYSRMGLKTEGNKLVKSLISKYLLSLGIVDNSDSEARKKFQAESLKLGFLEDYLTPELEEEYSAHEGTVQREITHTSDTNVTALMIIKRRNEDFVAALQSLNKNNDYSYLYLNRFANPAFKYFHRRDRYAEINLAVRLRKAIMYDSFAWPAKQNLPKGMSESFSMAIKTRDSGKMEMRTKNGLEVNAWNFENNVSAVMVAQGKSIEAGENRFAIFLIFPLLCGYALLLLYYLNNYFSQFLTGPLTIINKGITRLNNEFYGVTIASFSHDEFDNITRAFNEMSVAIKQRELIKRYVSEGLVQQVEDGSSFQEEGQLVTMTILASDIRGFTTISEKYSPAEVVEMLNSYFTAMESAINQYGGVIDKYVGDAVQAVFSNSPGKVDSAWRACQAAMAMRGRLADYNMERQSQGYFTIENGIGLATGETVAGSIGNKGGRRDYAVVGNLIEHAASLETQTRLTESKILLCSRTRQEAGDKINAVEFSPDSWELKYG